MEVVSLAGLTLPVSESYWFMNFEDFVGSCCGFVLVFGPEFSKMLLIVYHSCKYCITLIHKSKDALGLNCLILGRRDKRNILLSSSPEDLVEI